MKTSTTAVLRAIATLSLTGAALLFSSCKSADADPKKEAATENIVNVRVETVTPSEFRENLQLTGTVIAGDDITVPAEEGGRVTEWVVARGARVKKGQVIARLDDALLRAGFDAANAQYQLAELTATRQDKVFQEQGISEWQNKSFQYQRDAARAQTDLMKARLEKAQIKSPIAGIVDYRFVDAGEMVGPGAPVARVVDISRLKVSAGVPERYAGSFRLGDNTRFTVDALSGRTFHGRITFVGAAVSKDNRTIPVEISVTDGGGLLKPDMITKILFTLSARSNVITIKEDYVQQVDRETFVVFCAEGDIAREHRVKLGPSSNGFVVIESGLEKGDQLITLGFQNVAEGQKLLIQK
ncbi:MAG: efflux RND transporter periplasmic adaptor subunit [Ignavibacteriae bacterium]|nr:efflux RND transporter periplasmic adaptor subunit [Ignavibacteriota bacterium]